MENINSIRGIISTVKNAFKIPNQPIEPLPPPLILTGGYIRSGLSAQSIAARIISRQSQTGRQVGDVFLDGPNVEETMELIRIEEILNALHNEAVVNVAINPGTLVQTIGIGNVGAPVISIGATTSIASGNGIIR
jgi:hypothetical protein